jgi:hypothetical protein
MAAAASTTSRRRLPSLRDRRRWQVPHFEKMLYDNAQLASVYLAAWQATQRAGLAAVVRDVLDYLVPRDGRARRRVPRRDRRGQRGSRKDGSSSGPGRDPRPRSTRSMPPP